MLEQKRKERNKQEYDGNVYEDNFYNKWRIMGQRGQTGNV